MYPPLNLLALRVFGGSDIADYIRLISKWRSLGPIHMLDGPDTAGQSSKELLQFISGKLHEGIVKTEVE